MVPKRKRPLRLSGGGLGDPTKAKGGPLASAAGALVVEGASFALGPMRPPPLRRGGLLRLGTTEAPSAEARGPLSFWDHRGPLR